MDEWTGVWMDGWVGGWRDGWVNKWMGRQLNSWMREIESPLLTERPLLWSLLPRLWEVQIVAISFPDQTGGQ